MNAPWRVLISGQRTAEENLSLDAAMAAACIAGRYSGLLRFHRYAPTVSLGRHEPLAHAVRADFCAREGIALVRRPTGGGSLYLDGEQLCWTLVFQRRFGATDLPLAQWMQQLTKPLIDALADIGVHARHAPPNDIEIDGRKIGSGYIDVSDRLVTFQGNLLLDVDTERMLKALRAPTEKLSPDGIRSARERLTTLREQLGDVSLDDIRTALAHGYGQALGRRFLSMPGPLPGTQHGAPAPARSAAPEPLLEDDWQSLTDATLQSFIKTKGGVLRALVRLDDTGRRIQRLLLAGAVQVHPGDVFLALDTWMRGAPIDAWEEELNAFFRTHPIDAIDVTLNDVYRVVRAALDRADQRLSLDLPLAQANTLMVHGVAQDGAKGILAQATVMLVPYCAKPPSCKWRHRDGCPECGLCEVGDAYRLARERGMRVVSINNFEHLCSVLEELRSESVPSYVGMCCEHFYLKRQHAFRAAGIPAVLMDITGANCYEMQQEDLAYAGRFEAQSHLNMPVLEQVMRFVPRSELAPAPEHKPRKKRAATAAKERRPCDQAEATAPADQRRV